MRRTSVASFIEIPPITEEKIASRVIGVILLTDGRTDGWTDYPKT